MHRRPLIPVLVVVAGLLLAAAVPAAEPELYAFWPPVLAGIGSLGVLLLLAGLVAPAWFMRRRRLYPVLGLLPGGVALYRGRRVGPIWHCPAFARTLGRPR